MSLRALKDPWLWLRSLWDHRTALRMSREQLQARQLQKFRRLAAHAQAHSPYYRAIIQERGIDVRTCVPTDFPVLTKQDIARHFDDIVTDRRITRARVVDFLAQSSDGGNLFDGKYHVMNTSGSSGQFACHVFSHAAWISAASLGVRVAPLRLRQRVAYVGVATGHSGGVNLAQSGNQGANKLFYQMRAYDVLQPIHEVIEDLNAFQPRVVTGYATMLKELAEAQLQGKLRIRPWRVASGGEPLLPDARALIERAFQTQVMNIYASTEHLYMGLTLPGSDGMHLMEDDLIFELHADHTCVTNLFNDTMPLIRYRMSDVLLPDERPRKDSYPYTKVQGLVGRQENALVFINENGQRDFIHPFVILDLAIPGLSAWQVMLESLSSFRIRVCLEDGCTESRCREAVEQVTHHFQHILKEKQMQNVVFEIERVDSLPIDPKTAKFRLVLKSPSYQDVPS